MKASAFFLTAIQRNQKQNTAMDFSSFAVAKAVVADLSLSLIQRLHRNLNYPLCQILRSDQAVWSNKGAI